jgi:hypothetical protein
MKCLGKWTEMIRPVGSSLHRSQISKDLLNYLSVLIRDATILVSRSTIRARARFFGCGYAALGAMQAR